MASANCSGAHKLFGAQHMVALGAAGSAHAHLRGKGAQLALVAAWCRLLQELRRLPGLAAVFNFSRAQRQRVGRINAQPADVEPGIA